ncbi:MAG: GntR family transcriptional regulator [Actinomycetota bacterium]|nr:GntR family transcriptional regulator [Actinomycetota bacterium]
MAEATKPALVKDGTSDGAHFPNPKLRRASSAEYVESAIREGILSGELQRGHRLTQDELAAQLGMSRIPVREAMIALDREGWVQFESSRGAYVTGLEIDDVRDHYELRGLVLGLIAERTAEAIDDDGRADLAELGRDLRAAPDVTAFAATNDRILRRLIRTTNSSRLTAALRVMPAIVPEGFFVYVSGARRIQERGIAEILKAIAARDASVAGRAMRDLLRRQGAAVIKAFDGRGLMNDRATVVESTWLRGDVGASADVVAARVRQQIFEGSLQAGQRLPQDDIANAVGVSRIPVREAIIALEREGWVRVEPHRGAYVNALDARVVLDHFTLYGLYFGFAARRAIEHMTPDAELELDVLAQTVSDTRTARDMERANTAYLQLLLATAASNRLSVVLRSMTQLVPGHFFTTVPGSVKLQRAGIPLMQKAIAAGDIEAANAASIELQLRQAVAVGRVVKRRRTGP